MKKYYGTMIFIGILMIPVIFLYAYFHVAGREIEYAENISADSCTVTIIRYQHMEWEQRKEYQLDAAQIEQLRELILKSSFTRDLADMVTFKDHDRYDIRVIFHNRQDAILIDGIGNEYITVCNQFDGKHLKIKNPHWKESLERMIESAGILEEKRQQGLGG